MVWTLPTSDWGWRGRQELRTAPLGPPASGAVDNWTQREASI